MTLLCGIVLSCDFFVCMPVKATAHIEHFLFHNCYGIRNVELIKLGWLNCLSLC